MTLRVVKTVVYTEFRNDPDRDDCCNCGSEPAWQYRDDDSGEVFTSEAVADAIEQINRAKCQAIDDRDFNRAAILRDRVEKLKRESLTPPSVATSPPPATPPEPDVRVIFLD